MEREDLYVPLKLLKEARRRVRKMGNGPLTIVGSLIAEESVDSGQVNVGSQIAPFPTYETVNMAHRFQTYISRYILSDTTNTSDGRLRTDLRASNAYAASAQSD